MDFVNSTAHPATWTLGFDKDGRELVVVVVKTTFKLASDGATAQYAEQQIPLTEADEFTGEPGLSAPLYETDFAHTKLHCDVLMNATAYAPNGRPAREVTVGARIGAMTKAIVVYGARVWQQGMFGLKMSEAKAFASQPISYDLAFGGVDQRADDPALFDTFLANPVGRGYSRTKKNLDGRPAPQTAAIGEVIDSPDGEFRPMAFGPIGRSWTPRSAYAGTYDSRWLAEVAPFWPEDFDPRYFQAAPLDQQIPISHGLIPISLRNLTPDGRRDFFIPAMHLPVLFIAHGRNDEQHEAVPDTLVIEPEFERLSVTWRITRPMRRSAFDLKEIVVGDPRPEAYRIVRHGGKPRISLAEIVRTHRQVGAYRS